MQANSREIRTNDQLFKADEYLDLIVELPERGAGAAARIWATWWIRWKTCAPRAW